jgi:transcriptional regulator with XRE-family HTH domain
MGLMSKFIKWLDAELEERKWNYAQVADIAGIDRSTLTHIKKGERRPGKDTCIKLAAALKIDEETVLVAAGIMKERTGEGLSTYDKQIIGLTKQLASKTEKDGFYGIAKAYIEATKSNRKGSTNNAGQGIEDSE